MKILNKKAISIIEYSVLFMIVIGAFLVMRHYIQRGIYATWAQSGQSYAFGRQFDPQKTIECSFDETSNQWYDRNCYVYYINNLECNGGAACQEGVITSGVCSLTSNSSCEELNNGESP